MEKKSILGGTIITAAVRCNMLFGGKTMKVKEVRGVDVVTGLDRTEKWDVYGTDLGIPVYSPTRRRMYFLFGDTEGISEYDKTQPRYWRGTVAGYTDDMDFTKGINWDGFLLDGEGRAKELVFSHHSKKDVHKERSKISQGGIEINGNLYVFYESICYWGPLASGYWYLNYGGTLKSTDGGETFEKVYDLTWIEPLEDDDRFENASLCATEDMNLNPSGVEFDAKAHIAPGFGQMYGCDGKDGYIYIFGRYGGRIHGIKVGRVKKESFEDFSAYEYLTEYDESGEAVWKPYREGLDAIIANPEKAEIIPAPTSNMSVAYNNYLQKWLLTYYYPNKGIMFATAESPYGPYCEPQMVLPIDHPELTKEIDIEFNSNSLYGGFTHEMMYRENGKIVPIVISQWYRRAGKNRFYGSRLFEIEFE